MRECCKGLGMKYVIVWAKTSQYAQHNFLNWNFSEKMKGFQRKEKKIIPGKPLQNINFFFFSFLAGESKSF